MDVSSVKAVVGQSVTKKWWYSNMNFSDALKEVKLGARIARHDWKNEENVFVIYQKGYPDGIKCNKQTAEAWGMNEGDLFCVEPYLQIRMNNDSHAMWVPAITDILAEDWFVVWKLM